MGEEIARTSLGGADELLAVNQRRSPRSEGSAARLGDRALFPDLGFAAYYAHAAIAPVSTPVLEATSRFTEDLARRGAAAFVHWDKQRALLRERFARLLGARDEEIALTSGTSHGLLHLALGLPLRAGDRIVTFAGEFPANIIPYERAFHAAGGTLVFLPAPDPLDSSSASQILDGVERELARGARYVSVSAVQFQTGYRMPLREIGELCRERDAYLLVDAIQGLGVVPFDAHELRVDALAGGAHKWLLGLEGAGLLFVGQRLREILAPKTMSWLSVAQAESFLFEGADLLRYDLPALPSARVFEGSTQNAIGLAALGAGLSICEAVTPAAIYRHVQEIHDALEEAVIPLGLSSLRPVSRENRSCILSFRLPPGAPLKEVALGLRARGVMVSTPDGVLRFAPHYANSLGEVALVEASLREILGR